MTKAQLEHCRPYSEVGEYNLVVWLVDGETKLGHIGDVHPTANMNLQLIHGASAVNGIRHGLLSWQRQTNSSSPGLA